MFTCDAVMLSHGLSPMTEPEKPCALCAHLILTAVVKHLSAVALISADAYNVQQTASCTRS